MEKVRRSAAIYFLIQGTSVFLWWVVLYVEPSIRKYFQLEDGSQISLMAFWFTDLSFLGAGSLAAAWLCLRNHRYLQIASWFVTGSVSYAAVYCLTFALITDVGWLGVTLMIPAMIWSGAFAVGLSFNKTIFRQAVETSTKWILIKTFTQIILVWTIILAVFPFLITIIEDRLGITRLQFIFQKPLAAVLFVAISLLGIISAYIMSSIGKGTPLPLDHATVLVIRGPYSFVRNPMALSGVGQGLAVALFLGSPLVVVYALMGSAIWQLIFRPLEEDDLEARFGDAYRKYKKAVICWLPRTRRYQIEGKADSSNSIERPSGRM
ncbi:MAG: methyltransferase family protein [Blastocatellia bacterium]